MIKKNIGLIILVYVVFISGCIQVNKNTEENVNQTSNESSFNVSSIESTNNISTFILETNNISIYGSNNFTLYNIYLKIESINFTNYSLNGTIKRYLKIGFSVKNNRIQRETFNYEAMIFDNPSGVFYFDKEKSTKINFLNPNDTINGSILFGDFNPRSNILKLNIVGGYAPKSALTKLNFNFDIKMHADVNQTSNGSTGITLCCDTWIYSNKGPNQTQNNTEEYIIIQLFNTTEVSNNIGLSTNAVVKQINYTKDFLLIKYESYYRLGVREQNDWVFKEQKIISKIVLEELNKTDTRPFITLKAVSRYNETHIRTLNLTWSDLIKFQTIDAYNGIKMSILTPSDQT